MNEAQAAAQKLLFAEIPENTLRGINGDFGLTLGFGTSYGQALQAVLRKRAIAGDKGAAELVKKYGHISFDRSERDQC